VSADDDVSRQAVLIISSDPLAAALLGAAVELSGHMPHFVRADERARAALLRVRPRLVLIDCDHTEACSDEFVGPAIMTGARVILFRSNRSAADHGDFSDRLGLRILNMPTEHEAITTIITEAVDD
jgi:DNA-binding NtrC family response regulator